MQTLAVDSMQQQGQAVRPLDAGQGCHFFALCCLHKHYCDLLMMTGSATAVCSAVYWQGAHLLFSIRNFKVLHGCLWSLALLHVYCMHCLFLPGCCSSLILSSTVVEGTPERDHFLLQHLDHLLQLLHLCLLQQAHSLAADRCRQLGDRLSLLRGAKHVCGILTGDMSRKETALRHPLTLIATE